MKDPKIWIFHQIFACPPFMVVCYCDTELLFFRYNQLLRIEEELGDACIYAGVNFRKP